MKTLFFYLALLVSLASFSQNTVTTDKAVIRQTMYLRNRYIDSLQHQDTAFTGKANAVPTSDAVARYIKGRLSTIPLDTIEIDPRLKVDSVNFTSSASVDTVWYYNQNGTKHLAGYIDRKSGLITPGVVTWVSALTFNVSPAVYYLGGKRYNSSASQVTLSSADPSNPRIDVIAVNSLGNVVVITGTAAATPAEPQVDPASQIYLTSVYIPASSLVPGAITEAIVYNDGIEWTGVATSGASINTLSTAIVAYKDSYSTQVSSFTSGSALRYLNNNPVSTAGFSNLSLYIYQTDALYTQDIYAQFYKQGVAVSNAQRVVYTKSTVNAWQSAALAFSQFTFSNTSFDEVRFTFSGASSNPLYIDYVRLQGGINQPGNGTAYIFSKSLINNNSVVTLVNDSGTVVGTKVYGSSSGTKGWYPSILTNITNPNNGEILTYINGEWVNSQGATSGWALPGNASTDSAANFLGTTDAKPLSFRTNNTLRMLINSITGDIIAYKDFQAQTFSTNYGVNSINLLAGGVPQALTGAILIGQANTFNAGAASSIGMGRSLIIGPGINVGVGYTTYVANGSIGIGAGGSTTTANGANSISVGTGNTSSGNYAQSYGNGASATGTYSIAFQGNVSGSSSFGSHANVGGNNSVGMNGATVNFDHAMGFGYFATPTASYQLVFGGTNDGVNYGVREVYFGTGPQGNNSATINGMSYSINGSGAKGTDKNGGNLTVAGGKGTGAGTPGDVIISTATQGTTGATLQTLTQRLLIKGNTGYIQILNVPTYADDTAAATGGLAVGTVYKSSDGVLRIKL